MRHIKKSYIIEADGTKLPLSNRGLSFCNAKEIILSYASGTETPFRLG
jgi:hypothetical protein